MTSFPGTNTQWTAERRGSALPLVLLLAVILTLSLTVAFNMTGTELRVVDDHREQNKAFALAESGRERFISGRASLGLVGPPAASDSVRVNLTGGYADVVMKRIRPAFGTLPALYVVRSTGVRTVARRNGIPAASRTVAEYVTYHPASITTQAAWTSLSGLRKNGSSGTLSGSDACGLSPPVAAVAVPDNPGYAQSGGAPVPEGSPAVDSLGSQQAANDSVKIDWPAIKTRGALGAGITIPGGSWPSFANPNYWPTIMVHGDFSLPGDGRGLLVVTGNLTIPGSRSWNGIVLVGQNIISNGNNTILGTAISGLDMKLGLNVPTADLGSGTKTFQYNSCFVASAIANVGWLVPYRNAWVDNWASY